jgi:hypothetical protein
MQLPVSETEIIALKLDAICLVWTLSLTPATSAIVLRKFLGGFVSVPIGTVENNKKVLVVDVM